MSIQYTLNKGRKAIAMVELIFAIVVIGITLLSIPVLVNQATQSTYTTLQQESIAAAASHMGLILSREWDEAGTDFTRSTPILKIDTTATLNESVRVNYIDSRTYLNSLGGGTLTPIGIGNDGLDDIDDLNGIPTYLTIGNDLLDTNVTITTNVNYLTDLSLGSDYIPTFPPSGTLSNIKGVTITLTSASTTPTELQKTIKLNAFSCNIGSYTLEREVKIP